MKIYIPTSPGWYVAIGIILGPLLSILLIQPEWLGRLVGISFFFLSAPFLAFWGALSPRVKFVRDDSWLHKRYDRRSVDIVARSCVFLAGVVALLILTVPFTKDLIAIANHQAPLSRVGLVTRTSGNALTGLVNERVALDRDFVDQDNSFSALFFPPRHIMQGNTYEFLYLLNTHIILEARRLPDVATTTPQELP